MICGRASTSSSSSGGQKTWKAGDAAHRRTSSMAHRCVDALPSDETGAPPTSLTGRLPIPTSVRTNSKARSVRKDCQGVEDGHAAAQRQPGRPRRLHRLLGDAGVDEAAAQQVGQVADGRALVLGGCGDDPLVRLGQFQQGLFVVLHCVPRGLSQIGQIRQIQEAHAGAKVPGARLRNSSLRPSAPLAPLRAL